MSARPISSAVSERDRARFQGPRPASVRCAWCGDPFTYERHIGRPRKYCSVACGDAASRDLKAEMWRNR